MNRRAMFLEVLGIPAEWVPRQPAGDEVGEEAGVPLAVEPAESVVAEAAAEVRAEALTEASAIPRAAPVIDPADAALELAETVEAFDVPPPSPPPAPRAAAPVSRLPDPSGRAAAIAAMAWPDLADSVAGCTACGLCESRTQTVFGVGDTQADWMLVGEAPGENEDLQGEPFVGQAGKLLDNMLGALGLARGQNVYIANVLKCRPPGNRNPEPDEVAACEPYLRRQIALIQPKVIVVLGRFAAQSLLRATTPIGKLRGTVHQYEGIPVVVTYHPAYLLRTLTDKARAWEDLCLAREVHDRAGAEA